MAFTPIEMFNQYTSNFNADHANFTGWLGEEMGYTGGMANFADQYSAYVTQFDPNLGLSNAFQKYYDETGINLATLPHAEQAEYFGGAHISSLTGPGIQDDIANQQVLIPGFEGAISNKFTTDSQEAKNEFEKSSATTQQDFGANIAGLQEAGAKQSGTAGLLKSGQNKRTVSNDISSASKIGSNLGDALKISREQAQNEFDADHRESLVDLKNSFNQEINTWYSQVMTGIESLAMEGIFDE